MLIMSTSPSYKIHLARRLQNVKRVRYIFLFHSICIYSPLGALSRSRSGDAISEEGQVSTTRSRRKKKEKEGESGEDSEGTERYSTFFLPFPSFLIFFFVLWSRKGSDIGTTEESDSDLSSDDSDIQ